MEGGATASLAGIAPPLGAAISIRAATVRASASASSRVLMGPIDMTVAPSETIAIVGPSGAGKSTLLKLMAGLYHATEGVVAVTPGQPGGTVTIGLAPQSPSLLPWLSLIENIELPASLGPGNMVPSRPAVDALLASLHLSGAENALPHMLSGGMQSRAALARALAQGPSLLLLDEPFGSLDDVTAENIMSDLSKLLTVNGSTAVLVSHNLAQAVFLADRVLVLSKGPARVVGEVAVPVSQPRDLEFLDSNELSRAVTAVRSLLRGGAA